MKFKSHTGLERLMTYASSFAILGYVLTSNILMGLVGGINSAITYTPSEATCYVTPSINCLGAPISSQTGTSTAVNTDELGTSLRIPPNSLGARLRSSLKEYMIQLKTTGTATIFTL